MAETVPLTAFYLNEVIDLLTDSNDVYLATAMTPIAVQDLKSFFRKPSGCYILPPPAKIIMPGHSCFFLLFAK
jgi:hypothetical protein